MNTVATCIPTPLTIAGTYIHCVHVCIPNLGFNGTELFVIHMDIRVQLQQAMLYIHVHICIQKTFDIIHVLCIHQ